MSAAAVAMGPRKPIRGDREFELPASPGRSSVAPDLRFMAGYADQKILLPIGLYRSFVGVGWLTGARAKLGQ